eukprot:gb/GECG01013303.1/.p1 GENE.gb/GECG01013303.1/~~gb/GECG01013303.1/.p1  ORF type:complete len:342 (+),score=45.22 gb/GECG01013303.1/:1-1026(+)
MVDTSTSSPFSTDQSFKHHSFDSSCKSISFHFGNSPGALENDEEQSGFHPWQYHESLETPPSLGKSKDDSFVKLFSCARGLSYLDEEKQNNEFSLDSGKSLSHFAESHAPDLGAANSLGSYGGSWFLEYSHGSVEEKPVLKGLSGTIPHESNTQKILLDSLCDSFTNSFCGLGSTATEHQRALLISSGRQFRKLQKKDIDLSENDDIQKASENLFGVGVEHYKPVPESEEPRCPSDKAAMNIAGKPDCTESTKHHTVEQIPMKSVDTNEPGTLTSNARPGKRRRDQKPRAVKEELNEKYNSKRECQIAVLQSIDSLLRVAESTLDDVDEGFGADEPHRVGK